MIICILSDEENRRLFLQQALHLRYGGYIQLLLSLFESLSQSATAVNLEDGVFFIGYTILEVNFSTFHIFSMHIFKMRSRKLMNIGI